VHVVLLDFFQRPTVVPRRVPKIWLRS
jgi:hypothetical protein